MTGISKEQRETLENIAPWSRGHDAVTAALTALDECEPRLDRLTEALEKIAELPCSNGTTGECPDHWAIGQYIEACPPCRARDALGPTKEDPS